MKTMHAPIYHFIKENKFVGSRVQTLVIIFTGIGFLSCLAQIKFFLPGILVPVTGQTFGVTFIALMYGRRLGVATVGGYILCGIAGLPIFAAAQAGLIWGPSSGYLIGMFFSSFVIGTFTDHGCTKKFPAALVIGFSGSLLVFFFGCLVLSQFVPIKDAFLKGVLPFIPGDILKTSLAAFLASSTDRHFKGN